jgi:hypothetical protein
MAQVSERLRGKCEALGANPSPKKKKKKKRKVSDELKKAEDITETLSLES